MLSSNLKVSAKKAAVWYLVLKPELAAMKILNDRKAEERHQVHVCPGNCVNKRYLHILASLHTLVSVGL